MARLPPNSPVPEYGSRIGPWIVGKSLGHGSYGTVFRAAHQDRPQDERYALKLASRAGDERFAREVWLLSRIHHPAVPRFEACGAWRSPAGETYPYVVMQRVEGLSLYAWALEHGLTLRQAISHLAQAARALQAVHQHGVHGDVKGGNIRVSDEGRAVLLDFGSGWYPGASPLTGGHMPPVNDKYRSPQMLMFEFAVKKGWKGPYEADPADDVYALGVTAYRLLANGYPPCAPDPGEGALLTKPARLKPPSGLEQVCPELGELIVRMLDPDDPKARGSAQQVAEELEALLEYTRPALDETWVANASRQPTEETPPPSPAERVPPPVRRQPPPPPPVPHAQAESELVPLLVLAGACLVLGLVLVLVLPRNGNRVEMAYTAPESPSQAAEQPDAGTSLGEEGLASVTPAESPPASKEKASRELPEKPSKDQKRPPCTQRLAVEINGGCWRLAPTGADKAPCDTDLFEHGNRCYFPILLSAAERVPTSDEPK
ncbi:MAG TPA: protein kinase [Myxococcaceae bacterium]